MTTIGVNDEIVLQRPSLSDAERVFALLDSNREHLGHWLPWVHDMVTVKEERRWLEDRLQPGAEGREYPLLIIYRDSLVDSITP